VVKKEKSEVKSEVTEMPGKQRKRDNGDRDQDLKITISNHSSDASARKKQKKNTRAKRHAYTEPGCGKDFASPSWLSISEGIRVKNLLCVLSQAAEKHLRREAI
jgi:hypothetical protein